ncbi:MAG: DNA polymerase III subunit chi [Gammaproteobacteria bacterium]|nr:DNA polymerase III subunit chi [Gammaproteobacteria bacterium]
MTQVDFYILNDRSSNDRFGMACRLAGKAWQQGHRIYLHTNSNAESQHIDRLLWTFRQDSFIPHSLANESDPDHNPILIGHAEEAGEEHDVLINLATEVPQFFSRFHRVAEFIDHDAEIKKSGRRRYCFYRDRGYPLNTHEI